MNNDGLFVYLVADGAERHGFVIDVPSPDGRRRQLKRRGFTSKKEARTARDAARSKASTGRGVTPSRMTLERFLVERWLPSLAADPKLKPTTVNGYRYSARHLVRGLGGVRLDELELDGGRRLTALYEELRAAFKSERTVRYVHVTAHRAFGAAVRWRLIAYNPADDATAPAQTPPQPTAWSPQQVGCFLDEAAGDRWWPLWRLVATTGMRRGELVGLQWPSVNLERAELVVKNNTTVVDYRLHDGTTKNRKARPIPLDAGTVEALAQWRRAQHAERLVMGAAWLGADYVFVWPDGSRLHPDVVTRTFARLRDRAGLPPLRLHNLRHAWATHAIDHGVEIRDVSSRLGHSSTRITEDIYLAPVPDRAARAATLMADLYDSTRRKSVTKP